MPLIDQALLYGPASFFPPPPPRPLLKPIGGAHAKPFANTCQIAGRRTNRISGCGAPCLTPVGFVQSRCREISMRLSYRHTQGCDNFIDLTDQRHGIERLGQITDGAQAQALHLRRLGARLKRSREWLGRRVAFKGLVISMPISGIISNKIKAGFTVFGQGKDFLVDERHFVTVYMSGPCAGSPEYPDRLRATSIRIARHIPGIPLKQGFFKERNYIAGTSRWESI